MAERLPAVRSFAATIESARAPEHRRMRIADSSRYLAAHAQDLAAYESADHLGVDAYENPDSPANGFAWHLFQIRVVLARALREQRIFIGATVLDELLLDAAKRGSQSVVLDVLERIRDSRMTRPGLMIFPVHSFGILAAGILQSYTDTRIAVVRPPWGIAVSPQTNSLDRTFDFLDGVRRDFGVRQRLPVELLEHWRRSRPTKWLERNPLVVVRAVNVPGYYYDNEPLLFARLRAVTALLAMLAALQPSEASRGESLFSSSHVNNWQTLDIHHYIVLYNTLRRGGELSGDCIPIHSTRAIAIDASDLNIDLDSTYWSRRRQDTADRLHDAVDHVYGGYLMYGRHRIKGDARSRVYRKTFDSLSYFKQSFSRSDHDWRATVSLATAFEMLLTDTYREGVTARLQRRTKILLSGVRGRAGYEQAVTDVYAARSEIVHSGARTTDPDLHAARQAWVRCFLGIVDRLPQLNTRSGTPVSDLLGDPP